MMSPHTPTVPWPAITPLSQEIEPPAFPTRALPGWLADYIEAEAIASQTPEDLLGMLALAALSTAVQGRINALANGGTWIEPIGLYIAIAMNPGERKSAVFKAITAPLEEWELEIQEIERPEIAASRQRYRELEQEVENTNREVNKANSEIRNMTVTLAAGDAILARRGDLERTRDIAVQAQLEYDNHREIAPMRLLFDDITPEAVATALSVQNGERLGILSPEGGIFDILGGRYSDKPALDIFLKGHAADSYRVDRKGRESEIIHRPMISLGLAVQPAVFQAIGQSKDMHGRGLLARFLYSVPTTLIGGRDITADGIPQPIRNEYFGRMKLLAGHSYSLDQPIVAPLSPEADEVFMAYQRDLEPRLTPEVGDLDPIIEWASKLAGALLRIATLIGCARAGGIPAQIEEEDIIAGLAFAPYLEAHAWRAFGLMGLSDNDNTIQSRIIRRITRAGWESFTTRDLRRTLRTERLEPRELQEILRDIAQRTGMIRERSLTPSRSDWEVNPEVRNG